MSDSVAGPTVAVPAGIPTPRMHSDAMYRYLEPETGHRAEDRLADFTSEPAERLASAERLGTPERLGAAKSVGTTEQTGRAQRSDPTDWAGTGDRSEPASGRAAGQRTDRLRDNGESSADRGSTTITDEVVEKIVEIAVRQIPGVYDLGGDVSLGFTAMRERAGRGETGGDTDRGISVKLTGNTATVRIALVVEYGAVVRAVTEGVRENVVDALEGMLELQVTVVDIVVDDIHVDDEQFAESPLT